MRNTTVPTPYGPVRLSEAETAAHAVLLDGRTIRPEGERRDGDTTTAHATMPTMLSLVALRLARWEHGGIVASLAPAPHDLGAEGEGYDGRDECDGCGEDLSPGEGYGLCRVCRAQGAAS